MGTTRITNSLCRLALALIVMSPFVAIEVCSAAGRVFFDGFEDGTTNAWQQDDYRNTCVVVTSALDGGPGPRGTKMLRCNWNGTVAWNDAAAHETLVLNTWSYSQELLIRFWARYDNDCDHAMGSKLWRIGSSENSIGSAQLEQGDTATLYMNWFDASGNALAPVFWGDGSAPIGNHQWHKIELYFKGGNGNAIIRAWTDGTLIYNVTNATSDTRWYPFHLVSNWSNEPDWAHDANNHVYWDDFEIYSDTGTGATGLMSDATISSGSGSQTAPTAPQSAHITP